MESKQFRSAFISDGLWLVRHFNLPCTWYLIPNASHSFSYSFIHFLPHPPIHIPIHRIQAVSPVSYGLCGYWSDHSEHAQSFFSIFCFIPPPTLAKKLLMAKTFNMRKI